MKASAKPYLLDTSALLTLIEGEKGAGRVEAALRRDGTLIFWLSLLEVHYITHQEPGLAEADRRYALLKHSPAQIVWEVDEPILLAAARFKARHRMSLADALIAACAVRYGAVLLHKDPEFESLRDELALEALPAK